MFSRGDEALDIKPLSRLQISDGEAMVSAAVLGLGLTRVPDYMVATEIATGRLVEIVPAHRSPAQIISVVYPSGRLVPPRVRAAVDAFVALGRSDKAGRGARSAP